MERVRYIDIMKGIGIVLVVIGHSEMDADILFRVIYLFHMPLFFIVSGYLFKKDSNKGFIVRKARQLLIPYFIFLLLLMPFSGILTSTIWDSGDPFFIAVAGAKVLIGGRNMLQASSPLWFITCLFLTQILYNYIANRFSENVIGLISILFLALAYVNRIVFADYWLPWNGNVVLYALPLFHIGHVYHWERLHLRKYVITILSVIVILGTVFLNENMLDMKSNIYGIPIVTFACGIVLVLMVRVIAKWMERVKYLSKIFAQLGRASLIMMYVHFFILLELKRGFGFHDWLCILLSISFSYLIFLLINHFSVLRAVMAGSVKDQDKLIGKFSNKNNRIKR